MTGPTITFVEAFDDPRVMVYRNVRDADLRGRDDLFMAESELVLRRLMRTPDRLHSMLVSRERFERLREPISALPANVSVFVADLKLIHEIAAFHVHRGCLAAGYRYSNHALALEHALGHVRQQSRACMVLAEGLTNVDNMGALFRNAAAFGVDGVLLDPTCCDPLYRKAIRVSMGHTLSVPYAVSSDWLGDLRRLKDQWGLTIVASEIAENARPTWEMPAAQRIAFVFGSEGHGVSRETLAMCDAVCAIPMFGESISLNVAVASAVALYEHARGLSAKRGS